MGEMIERVSRALAAKHYSDRFRKPVFDDHVQMNVNLNWRDFSGEAETAIEAMRRPSDLMAEAGTDYLGKFLDVSGTYTAMIDAALK